MAVKFRPKANGPIKGVNSTFFYQPNPDVNIPVLYCHI